MFRSIILLLIVYVGSNIIEVQFRSRTHRKNKTLKIIIIILFFKNVIIILLDDVL